MIIPVMLAPMAGITDKPFRKMVRLFGSQPLITEMVGVESLHRNHPVTRKMMDIRDEKNIIVQLVGVNAQAMVEAAKMAEDYGAIGVNINMGCPVKKLISNGSGAALLKDVDRASFLVEAVAQSVHIPVSVKTRIGWDESSIFPVPFAQQLENAGAAFMIVHGRTKAQGYSGQARYDVISEIQQKVNIPVWVNGDVVDYQTALYSLERTHAQGVVVGRGTLGKPWALSAIETGVVPDFLQTDLIFKHLDLLMDYYGPHGLLIARKHLAWYARGKKGVAEFCRNVYAEQDLKKVKELVRIFFEGET